MWFNDATPPYQAARSPGTPAGGLPNLISPISDGTFRFERDLDPEVWTKSGVALNGNTHTGGPGATPTTTQGAVPDITTNPDASFWIATFIHNDGQSNGNGGWCMADPSDPAKCRIPNNISNTTAGAGAGAAEVLHRLLLGAALREHLVERGVRLHAPLEGLAEAQVRTT